MEAFNFTTASEDSNCYTFDMRKLEKALNVHQDHVSAVFVFCFFFHYIAHTTQGSILIIRLPAESLSPAAMTARSEFSRILRGIAERSTIRSACKGEQFSI